MIYNKAFIEGMHARVRSVDFFCNVDGKRYGIDNIISLNPYYSGSLMSAIMRCLSLEIQFDEDIDAETVTTLKGKSVTGLSIGAKSECLGSKIYPLFENKILLGIGSTSNPDVTYEWYDDKYTITVAFEYSVDVKVSVNEEYSLYIFTYEEGQKPIDLSTGQSFVIPADTKVYISLSRADGESIEKTEAANIVFEPNFSYIEYGDYTIYDAEFIEESNSVVLTCYDKMLQAAVPYNMEISNDMTVKDFLLTICGVFDWSLADVQFANQNEIITAIAANSYLPEVQTISDTNDEESNDNIKIDSLESKYTYRDVLEDIAEIIGGSLIFNNKGELCPTYPSIPRINGEMVTLPLDNQEMLSFKKQFGAINGVAIIDNSKNDAVKLMDEDSISINGECCINIVDNYLMNTNREAYINGIFDKLNGLYYVPFEFESYGFGYLEYGDIVNIEDRKGNLKQSIILCDNFKLGLAVSESASATVFSADSDGSYSATTPFDRLKVEVKKIASQSSTLAERVQNATSVIRKTTNGHAVLVDLEYDEVSGKYYVGDGLADTLIVSENPAVATDDSPLDWSTGRVIRINYDGIAVSTTGIGGVYKDFAVYYDKERDKYLVNADDISVGTLKGVRAILESGNIAGWEIEKDADDYQLVAAREIEQEGKWYLYEVILKNDQSFTMGKKVMYCNRYSKYTKIDNGDGTYSYINKSDKTEVFYITRDGQAFFNHIYAGKNNRIGDMGNTLDDLYVSTKLTVAGSINLSDNVTYFEDSVLLNKFGAHILWSGGHYMNGLQTITLSENISEQSNGIVLIWSPYTKETDEIEYSAKDEEFQDCFISKAIIDEHSGVGHNFHLVAGNFSHIARKYLYFTDSMITGSDVNTNRGTNNGITYANDYFVLRYVIGV